MLYRIEGDDVSLVDTLGVVRSDAVNSQVAPMTGGGCAAATEVGMGYTAVSLRVYGADGTLDWEVVEDGTCYDSPCGLVEASDGGLYLLWDSWSDDRGLWVMRLDPQGSIEWRIFTLPTLHPMPSRICPAPDGGCLVAATTLVLEGEICVVLLDGEGRPETTWSAVTLEEAGAVSPVGLWADREGIRSAWTLEPGQTHLDTLVLLDLSWDGTVSTPRRFELHAHHEAGDPGPDSLFNTSAWAEGIEYLPDGRFILFGSVPHHAQYQAGWIGTADRTGALDIWDRCLGIDPVSMAILPDGTVLLTGAPQPGYVAPGFPTDSAVFRRLNVPLP